jgi:glucose/arabinose dehydrogenase
MKKLLFLFITLLPLLTLAQPKLTPHKVTLKDGRSFNLNLPEDYEIIPAAEGLKRVRFFAKAPDGRMFVTDMYNLADNTRGSVYILDGWNAETGKFAKVTPYMTGLKNPNSVQFYTDAKGQDWLYLAETDKLTRRKFTKGETKPTDTKPQTLATFPDYGLSYKYGGWHLTRTIAFSNTGKLYVSVGSSCNACVEKEKVRASIVEMNPDGSGQRQFAGGLRNAVGVKWIGNSLFATNQGSDHLGLSKPDETFYALKDGADYGWPYCHSANGKIFADPTFKRAGQCGGVPVPYAFFPAHSSGLGFDYFDDAGTDAAIKDSFLVSLHGATNKETPTGYRIVIMRKGQKVQDFLNGFMVGSKVNGRPCDIKKLDANSFLFTDDNKGIVYYVRKKGWKTQMTAGIENQGVENENTAQSENPTEGGVSPTPQASGTCWPLGLAILAFCVRTALR